MPRVYKVEKTRKDQGQCGKCGCEIKKGDPYLYWEFRYGGRRIRCTKPGCHPKPSDLTQSDHLSQLYSLQETPIEGDTPEDLESVRDELAERLRELSDECQGKLDNMPEGLQQGSTGELLQERIDSTGQAADTLEGIDCSFDEPERQEEETDEVFAERRGQALDERLQEIRDEISDALSSCS